MTTAIVVDDEKNLADHLIRLLADVWPDLQIIDTATNGDDAVALIQSQRPDIAFLDIHMPGVNGIEVAKRVASLTSIVFVTAYDEFAVEAFENAAIDYVLKPATQQRLEKTVARLKAMPARQTDALPAVLLDQLLQQLQPVQSNSWLQWLRVGSDDQTRLIPVTDVVYFLADNKYTTLFTSDDEHLIRTSISELSETLDPDQFWRIHRSIIVKVSEIEEARRDIRGRYTLTLKSSPTQLRSSQRYGHLFKLV